MDKVKVYRYGLVMRPYAEALLATYKELEKQGKPVPDLDNQSLERMDKVTFRTPDYQLSTVQDYRKGRPGSQQHIWQATLGPRHRVFTINPGGTQQILAGAAAPQRPAPQRAGGGLRRAGGAPAGTEDRVPARRHRRRRALARAVGGGAAAPHAGGVPPGGSSTRWCRRATGRSGARAQGYIALWSRNKTSWSNDVFGGEGLVAEGRKNVWVAQLGRREGGRAVCRLGGQVAAAAVTGDRITVAYQAPGVGRVSFGWEGPLRVGGQEIPLADYARFDNPCAQVPWGQGRYEISHAGHKLMIDFDKNQHRETGPAAPIKPRADRQGRRGAGGPAGPRVRGQGSGVRGRARARRPARPSS